MTLRVLRCAIALVALALLPTLTPSARAGDFEQQQTFGGNSFFASPACRVKQFPTFESIAAVPRILDPFEQDMISVFCQIQVNRDGEPVNKAKGQFDADVIVIDNNTGLAESFSLESGRFKTDSEGRDSFDYDIPAEIFADGFESGDVSAWSYTRTTFTNNKKADGVSMACSVVTSRSSQ